MSEKPSTPDDDDSTDTRPNGDSAVPTVQSQLDGNIELPDGYTEDETERDGVFSYAAEWHAFTHGVFLGITTKPWRTPPEPTNRDVDLESHYYRGGYVIGTLLQVALLLLLGRETVESMNVLEVLG